MIIIVLVMQFSEKLEGSHESLGMRRRLAAFVFVIILDQWNIRIVLTIGQQPLFYSLPETPPRHGWFTCAANKLKYSLYRSYEKKILPFSLSLSRPKVHGGWFNGFCRSLDQRKRAMMWEKMKTGIRDCPFFNPRLRCFRTLSRLILFSNLLT